MVPFIQKKKLYELSKKIFSVSLVQFSSFFHGTEKVKIPEVVKVRMEFPHCNMPQPCILVLAHKITAFILIWTGEGFAAQRCRPMPVKNHLHLTWRGEVIQDEFEFLKAFWGGDDQQL